MTLHRTFISVIILGVLTLAAILLSNLSFLGAANTQERDVTLSNAQRYGYFTLISASTTNATSTELKIAGADRVQVYFTRNDGTFVAGQATSTFYIQVTPDGTNWYNYNKLISNVTNTNSQDVTRVGSVTIETATSTLMYALDLENDVFQGIRCIANHASTTLDALANNTCTVALFGLR